MDDSSTKSGAPEHQTHSDRGGHSLWFVWAFFIIVVIYPLSFGPALKIYEKHPAAGPAIETAYRPIFPTLIRHSKPAEAFFDWYLFKLWKFHPPVSPPPTGQTNSAAAPGK